jgi:SH3-like domain-containing protein
LGGLALLLFFLAFKQGREVLRADGEKAEAEEKTLSGTRLRPEGERQDHSVVRSQQVRTISERKPIPRSIRVAVKFVEVKTNTTEELAFDWVDLSQEFPVVE